MREAGPALLVNEKRGGEVTPAAETATVYGPPAVVFAAKAAEMAPLESVANVMLLVLLLNVPLGPVAGAVKVTLALGTTLL